MKCTIFLRHIIWFTGMLPFLCLFSFLSFFSCAWSSNWDKIPLRLVGIRVKYLMARLMPGDCPSCPCITPRASPPVDEFKGKGIERRSLMSCYNQNCCITTIIVSLSNKDGNGNKHGKKQNVFISKMTIKQQAAFF